MATGSPNTQTLATPIRYRRKVQRLKAGQLDLLQQGHQALMSVGDDRGWTHWAGVHGLPLPIGCRNAHGTPLFLPWHRAYLYRFERAMRDRVPNAMAAWWDWRTPNNRQSELPKAYASQQLPNGDPNPLHSGPVSQQALAEGRARGVNVAQMTERAPSRSMPLPRPREIDDLIRIRDFGTFSDALDSIHGTVHMWVGGHMTEIDFAAFDPIFWAHHAMVDRIWRLWQLEHNQPGPPRTLWDQALEPFGLTVAQTLDVTRMGYDYAGASDSKATPI